MVDLALVILRATFGGLLAGHGAQKLFGSFGGRGLRGTTQMMESMRLRPGQQWALAAGGAELGGGALTALGLLGPVGPAATIGAMGMATGTVHWGKPVWVTSGGAELPLTNMAIATALLLTGPGALSLDRALGLRPPRWLAIPALAGALAGVALGLRKARAPAPEAAPSTTTAPQQRERSEPESAGAR